MRKISAAVVLAAVFAAGCGGSDKASPTAAPSVSKSSCRHPDAIKMYGSYEKCAEFARSIGDDPETGKPLK